MSLLKLVPLWLWVTLLVGVALALQGWRLDAVVEDLRQAQTANTQLTATNTSLRQTATLQRQLAQDAATTQTTYQQALDHAQSEKAGLDAALADATIRLRVKGRCVREPSPDQPTAGQPDDDTFRLDAAAERDYSALRAGLQSQRAQIVGLQEYVRTLSRYCKISG